MTPSKILFYFCISFVSGIFLESIIKIPQVFLWFFLIIGVLITFNFLFFKKDIFFILGFCLFFIVFGILRTQIAKFDILNDDLSKFNDKEKIILTGKIISEPEIRDNFQRIKVKSQKSTILITTDRFPKYEYLDELEIEGKLQTPMESEDFNYRKYLLKDRIYSVMFFPEIKIIGKSSRGLTSGIYSGILWVKEKLRDSIRNNFLPPHSSVLEGVLLGDKGAVSQELKEKFRITGLSHIIAVSGMHVVILSSIIMFLLIFAGIKRGQAFYGAVFFILIYVILVGLPSSAVRAGIMGTIYLLAQKIGRQTMSPRIVVLAASFMLLINPLLLFYDIGFQLSFLAVLGLIYLEPVLRQFFKLLIFKFLKFKIKEKYESSIMIFSATISAQIFTLPIIVYNFGNFSFVSPITNALVLPVIYGIMFFGFISALIGIFSSAISWIVALPCYFLLSYFFWIINIFSKPWAFKIIENVSWIWILILYFLLIVVTGYFHKKLSFKI
jgi:competence protein ComEC